MTHLCPLFFIHSAQRLHTASTDLIRRDSVALFLSLTCALSVGSAANSFTLHMGSTIRRFDRNSHSTENAFVCNSSTICTHKHKNTQKHTLTATKPGQQFSKCLDKNGVFEWFSAVYQFTSHIWLTSNNRWNICTHSNLIGRPTDCWPSDRAVAMSLVDDDDISEQFRMKYVNCR